MLAISPLRSHKDDNRAGGGQNMAVVDDVYTIGEDIEFPDFYNGNLLESIIDFDDIFIDGNVLPDLVVDPELVAEFSPIGGEKSGACCSSVSVERGFDVCTNANDSDALLLREEEEGKSSPWSDSNSRRGEEVANDKRDKLGVVKSILIPKDCEKARKSSSSLRHHSKNSKNPQGGKRKVKVDWTPELHRRFVDAVEQLGVDKAVPSRILEIMGIDCLTRHNIASHLQKYRLHMKHLLAREAEATTWSQRRHLYSSGGNKLRPGITPAANVTMTTGPWLAASATIGFPPPVASPHPVHPRFRPLHVWGHPLVDQSLAFIWPKHLLPHHSPFPPGPLPGWVSVVPPHHAPWHPHQRVTGGALTRGTPCYPQPLQPTCAGFSPHAAVYKVDHHGFGVPMFPGQSSSVPPFDIHPSKETIDAAIGDALTKPWVSLPLGLKPPSLDGVLGELHRQGIPDIHPSSSSSS